MSVSRIGAAGGANRGVPSAGHETVDRALGGGVEVAPSPRDARVHDVAKLYEKQFLREMVKAMRGTVSFSDATKPSMAENIYRDQLDEQYVESWGDNGGIGLSNLIYDQIMERYFNGDRERLRQQGPIALTDRDIARVSRATAPAASAAPVLASQVPLRIEVKPSGVPVRLQAPWDGEVVSNIRVSDKTAVTLEHVNGLRSTFIFDGVAGGGVEPGRKIDRSGTVGVLSPEINSFFWNLHKAPAP